MMSHHGQGRRGTRGHQGGRRGIARVHGMSRRKDKAVLGLLAGMGSGVSPIVAHSFNWCERFVAESSEPGGRG